METDRLNLLRKKRNEMTSIKISIEDAMMVKRLKTSETIVLID